MLKAGMETVNGEDGANSQQLADGVSALNQGLNSNMLTTGRWGGKAEIQVGAGCLSNVDVSEQRGLFVERWTAGKARPEASGDALQLVRWLDGVVFEDSYDLGQAGTADQAICGKRKMKRWISCNSRLESAAAQLRESSSAVREAGESVSAAADAAVLTVLMLRDERTSSQLFQCAGDGTGSECGRPTA